MANTKNAPAAPAGDEELFDQAINADTAGEFVDGGQGEPPAPPAAEPEPEKVRVPISELLDERDRRRKAEERLQKYDDERRQQQEQPVDPILRPDEYFDRRFQAALDPIRRQFTMQLANANKSLAVALHGADAVEEAQKAFDAETAAGKLHPAEHARVFTAANPFAAAVEWFNARKVLTEVGNDPKAYRERLLEEALSDPTFLGRAIEAARSQAAGRPVTAAPQRQAPRASPTPAQPGRTPPLPSLNRQGPPGGQPPMLSDVGDADLYEEMTNPAKFTE